MLLYKTYPLTSNYSYLVGFIVFARSIITIMFFEVTRVKRKPVDKGNIAILLSLSMVIVLLLSRITITFSPICIIGAVILLLTVLLLWVLLIVNNKINL